MRVYYSVGKTSPRSGHAARTAPKTGPIDVCTVSDTGTSVTEVVYQGGVQGGGTPGQGIQAQNASSSTKLIKPAKVRNLVESRESEESGRIPRKLINLAKVDKNAP